MATPSAPAARRPSADTGTARRSVSGRRAVAAAGLAGLLLAPPAAALDFGPRDFGLRLGASLNPDQVHGGFHAQLGRGASLRFRPSLELGVGNGVRLVSLNGDLLLRLGRGRGRLQPYLGGGPTLNLIDVTDGVGEARGAETKVAASVLLGVATGRGRRRAGPGRYLLEARAGFGDTPDFKMTVGLAF